MKNGLIDDYDDDDWEVVIINGNKKQNKEDVIIRLEFVIQMLRC